MSARPQTIVLMVAVVAVIAAERPRYGPSATPSSVIPHDCAAYPPTLPSRWDTGKCLQGARHGTWSVALNGSIPPSGSTSVCNAAGSLSCETRSPAWAASNVLLKPSGASSGKVVVFLPGTGGQPSFYSKLLQAAADAGHHVLGLGYLSQPVETSQSNAWCEVLAADAGLCNQELHELMLTGVSPQRLTGASQGLWEVPTETSVTRLIWAALNSTEWGEAFLSPDRSLVLWDRLVISGHSQGASHAAYLASKAQIPAVLFSGPQDCDACSHEWLSSRRWPLVRALFHQHEECGPDPIRPASYCERDLMRLNYELMRLRPSLVWNGTGVPDVPGSESYVVQDQVAPSIGCKLVPRSYHASVALDFCAPFGAGIEELWRRMFTGL